MPPIEVFGKDTKAIELLKKLVGFDTTSYNSNLNLINFIKSYLKLLILSVLKDGLVLTS